MLRLALAAALLATASLAAAQEAPLRAELSLGRHGFTQRPPALHHGQLYVLTLRNATATRRDIVARRFFPAAKVVPSSMGFIDEGGKVHLNPNESVDILLRAPDTPGRYRVGVSHFWRGGHAIPLEVD